jgi:hypothetical protein
MTAQTQPTTYAELFANGDLNPFGRGEAQRPVLQSVYRSWRTDDKPHEEALLMAGTVNAFDLRTVGGIGVFVRQTDGRHLLRVIHGIRRYPGKLGDTGPLVHGVFGVVGNPDDGFEELVHVQASIFGVTGEVNVCTVDRHRQLLKTDPSLLLIPARDNTGAQTETKKARMSAFIPFELVPLVSDMWLAPRVAFLVIDAYLTANGTRTEYQPLLDFLRIAGTSNAAGSFLNALTEVGPKFRGERGHNKYMRSTVILQDLQGLRREAPGSDPATLAVQSALTTMSDIQLVQTPRPLSPRHTKNSRLTSSSIFAVSPSKTDFPISTEIWPTRKNVKISSLSFKTRLFKLRRTRALPHPT